MTQRVTYTNCNICVSGCGLKVTSENNQVIKVEPDKESPAWRDFCVKGGQAYKALTHPARITQPMKRVGDRYVPVPYKQAVKEIAAQLNDIIDRHGANAVGSYTGNPGASNFGGFVFLSLLLDAIGTDSRYFVGSLDENALHYVCEEMYNLPWTILQADIENTDCLLLVGANPAISEFAWLFSVTEGWKKAEAMRARGGKIFVVDPRRTESASKADHHIAPLPNTDWALLLAVLHVIAKNRWYDPAAAADCDRFEELIELLVSHDLVELGRRCDVPVSAIENLAREFSKGSGICLAHTGVGQSSTGSVGVWLSHLLNLITGNLRRRGGLYHMRGALDLVANGSEFFPKAHRVSRVNKAPSVAGFLPVTELHTELTTPGEGQLKAFIIQGGNPVISGPEGDKLDQALAGLECLIAVDSFQRESHRHAHWLMPVPSFLELNEVSALVQELSASARVQMQRPVVDKPAGVPYEWEFFRDLALAMNKPFLMGKPILNWLVKGLSLKAKITGNPYDGFSPKTVVQTMYKKAGRVDYRDIEKSPHGVALNEQPDYDYFLDNLDTESGKVQVMPEALLGHLQSLLASPVARADREAYPLQMISRRRKQMMNSWMVQGSVQTMKSPEGDVIEVCEEDARALGLNDGESVTVRSAVNSLRARLKVSDRLRPGVAVMVHGWGGNTYNPSQANSEAVGGVNRNLLVSVTDYDPLTRVPKLNGTGIRIERLQAQGAA